jgi:hypothetical protein
MLDRVCYCMRKGRVLTLLIQWPGKQKEIKGGPCLHLLSTRMKKVVVLELCSNKDYPITETNNN